MYQPKHFTEADRDKIFAFMQQHPFVTLTVCADNEAHITQIPVMVSEEDGELYITGHVFKYTDHYKALEATQKALVLFTGAHCYVSAGWYSKRGQASTWNYMSVQAKGTIELLDEAGTRNVIQQLTHLYEHTLPQPELMEHMDEAYISANLKAIAGFKMKVADLKATFKLNQNKDDESYKNVVAQLMATNKHQEQEIAQAMMQERPELFG